MTAPTHPDTDEIHALRALLQEAKEENGRLRAELAGLDTTLNDMFNSEARAQADLKAAREENARLRAELEKARKVLTFYADEDNWRYASKTIGAMNMDEGDKARLYLQAARQAGEAGGE